MLHNSAPFGHLYHNLINKSIFVQLLSLSKIEAKLYVFDKIKIRLIYPLTRVVKYVVIIVGQCWTFRFGMSNF